MLFSLVGLVLYGLPQFGLHALILCAWDEKAVSERMKESDLLNDKPLVLEGGIWDRRGPRDHVAYVGAPTRQKYNTWRFLTPRGVYLYPRNIIYAMCIVAASSTTTAG